ncbi:hypothetical protein AAE478_009059 [Parahypoxylon ruwenzoriense]
MSLQPYNPLLVAHDDSLWRHYDQNSPLPVPDHTVAHNILVYVKNQTIESARPAAVIPHPPE